jgi:hypothetical protein
MGIMLLLRLDRQQFSLMGMIAAACPAYCPPAHEQLFEMRRCPSSPYWVLLCIYSYNANLIEPAVV